MKDYKEYLKESFGSGIDYIDDLRVRNLAGDIVHIFNMRNAPDSVINRKIKYYKSKNFSVLTVNGAKKGDQRIKEIQEKVKKLKEENKLDINFSVQFKYI